MRSGEARRGSEAWPVSAAGTSGPSVTSRPSKVKRAVRVAFITADSIALESGIEAGESVITDGALFLENGEAVEVRRDATKQAVNPPAPGAEG